MPVPTPHITASADQIAKTVLMPGDPLRSEFIAKNYLENPVLVNDVRGVHGYTGTYKGSPVTVMASGMGQPSIGIYSYELFNFYDVDAIIRVGSCGAFHPDLHVRDIVIAMGACTNSFYASQFGMPGTFAPIADFDLVRRAADLCEKRGVNYKVGNIFSSDTFYNAAGTDMEWAKMGVLGVEMESAALYCNAAWAKKKALCICTVSDNFLNPEENATVEERQNSFTDMMEIALGLI
jgi:purine-nucleoside phosphorylase